MKSKRRNGDSRRIALVILLSAVAVFLLWRAGHLRSAASDKNRGTTYGLSPVARPVDSLWGVNVSLEQYSQSGLSKTLQDISSAGFRKVRQEIRWSQIEPAPGEYDWDQWDQIVSEVYAHGLEMVAVLDTAPPWARAGQGPHAPPSSEADFGRFAHILASRYGERVDYYQIWDEPNLSAHWGDLDVQPSAYARLLRTAASQIRAADPEALILAAGLAPTSEQGPLNLDESAFLRGLYDSGVEDFFDVVAAKPYGFWSGAEDRRVSAHVLNFSRLIRLREVMESHGDDHKPVWAVEWGWNALPPDWTGDPSPWGTDTQGKQVERLREAVARARAEWPWLETMFWADFQPAAPLVDPRWGFALVDPEGHPRHFYYTLQEMATAPPIGYPGRYSADHPTGHYTGEWRLAANRADIGHTCREVNLDCGSLTIPFYGTALDLLVQRGSFWAWLEVSVDGAPTNSLPFDEEGRAYAVLYDPLAQKDSIVLAEGLDDGPHEARIVAHGGWGQWAVRGWIVRREPSHRPQQTGQLLSATGVAFLIWAAWLAKGIVKEMAPFYWIAEHSRHLALPFAALSLAWFSCPWGQDVVLLSAGLFACCAAWRPLWALGAVLFALPFYMVSVPLSGLPVASLDLLAVSTTVGVMVRCLTRAVRSGSDAVRRVGLGRIPICGSVLASLVGLGLLSTFTAIERTPALVAYWRVMALPWLCYLLVWALPRAGEEVWQLIDIWVASSVVAATMGLCQYALGGTVSAEGVQRITGPYSSPNHLALLLVRVVPVLLAVVVQNASSRLGRARRRNWGYRLALLPILVGLYLTYSRAAWLLALPMGLLSLGLIGGVVWRRRFWPGVLVVLGATAPWWGTERLASLLDPGRGTAALRLLVWRGTLAMIAAYPLLGVGPGNFQFVYPHMMRPAAWTEPLQYHSHNVFLDFAAFLGLGGLALFIALMAVFHHCGQRLLRALPANRNRALVIGLLASAIGSLAYGLVDNGYFLPDLACLWALFLGLVDWETASLAGAQAPDHDRSATSIQHGAEV